MAVIGIRKDRPKPGPKVKNFVLMQELDKRGIAATQFAAALALPVTVVRGTSGNFPVERLEDCVALLNNWTGPITARSRGSHLVKPAHSGFVTREMLITE
jgi:hypothetical protein